MLRISQHWDEDEVEAHLITFLMTWQVNQVSLYNLDPSLCEICYWSKIRPMVDKFVEDFIGLSIYLIGDL